MLSVHNVTNNVLEQEVNVHFVRSKLANTLLNGQYQTKTLVYNTKIFCIDHGDQRIFSI